MIHEYYYNLTKGDKVKCTPTPQPNAKYSHDYNGHGAGYEPNLEFIITDIFKSTSRVLIFGGKESGGVYHTSIVNKLTDLDSFDGPKIRKGRDLFIEL